MRAPIIRVLSISIINLPCSGGFPQRWDRIGGEVTCEKREVYSSTGQVRRRDTGAAKHTCCVVLLFLLICALAGGALIIRGGHRFLSMLEHTDWEGGDNSLREAAILKVYQMEREGLNAVSRLAVLEYHPDPGVQEAAGIALHNIAMSGGPAVAAVITTLRMSLAENPPEVPLTWQFKNPQPARAWPDSVLASETAVRRVLEQRFGDDVLDDLPPQSPEVSAMVDSGSALVRSIRDIVVTLPQGDAQERMLADLAADEDRLRAEILILRLLDHPDPEVREFGTHMGVAFLKNKAVKARASSTQ